MSTQKKRKKAPLGRIMYADDEIPGEIVHDPATAMACIESEPGHSGFSPYLVIDYSNPDAVVEAMARDMFIADFEPGKPATAWDAATTFLQRYYINLARVGIAALGWTPAQATAVAARKVAGKEGR